MSSLEKRPDGFRVVAFIETHVLMTTRWLRTMDWNAIEGGFEKFDVVSIGATDRHSQRNAASVSEHRPFGAQFAPIGGIFACIFPHPEAI